jgi:hypothetical protein
MTSPSSFAHRFSTADPPGYNARLKARPANETRLKLVADFGRELEEIREAKNFGQQPHECYRSPFFRLPTFGPALGQIPRSLTMRLPLPSTMTRGFHRLTIPLPICAKLMMVSGSPFIPAGGRFPTIAVIRRKFLEADRQ